LLQGLSGFGSKDGFHSVPNLLVNFIAAYESVAKQHGPVPISKMADEIFSTL